MFLVLVCNVVYPNNSLIPLCDLAMLIRRPPPVLFVRALLNIVLSNEKWVNHTSKGETFEQTFPLESGRQGASGD
jgi:hypothetical protein